MSRPKTEHGKRVALSVKVSEPKAQAVDARRGMLTRAAYLESLIDADLNGFTGKPEGAARPGAKRRAVPPARRAAPTASELARERARDQRDDDAPQPEPVPDVKFEPAAGLVGRVRCPHPGTRVIGGWCAQCGVVVRSDGYLP